MSPSLDIPLLTFHGAALAPLVADYDGLLVLPLPGDGRLGVASNEQILVPDMKIFNPRHMNLFKQQHKV